MPNKLCLTLYTCVFLCSLTTCKKAVPDYTSPFYKVFEGKSKGRKYIIHLYRLPSVDTFDGPQYSGSIYDVDAQIPMQFESFADRTIPQSFSGNRAFPFRLEINAAANRLTGFQFFGESDSMGRLHDSASFTAKEVAMSVPFQYSGTAGARYYDTARENSPQCQYRYGILRPALKDTVVNNILRREMDNFFAIPDTAEHPAQLLADEDYRAFMDGFKNLKGTELEEQLGLMMSSSSASKTSQVVFTGKRWLTLVLSSTWSGGTHEQTECKYIVYDLETGNKLKLRDVLTSSGTSKLPKMLAQILRRQYKLNPGESLTKAGLYENIIYPGKNFYITEKGVGFFYNNYEIASFASGSYDLFIPFTSFGEDDVIPLFKVKQ